MANENDYETSFTFRKTNQFWNQLNKALVIKDRDTLNDSLYHLILFSSLPSDFNNCIDEYGCLKTSDKPTSMVEITEGYTDVEFHIGVEWLNNGESGFNLFVDEWEDNEHPNEEGNELVDINIPIDEGVELYVKGIALCKTTASDNPNHENFVVAYARPTSVRKSMNYITVMAKSSFVGHKSCEEA